MNATDLPKDSTSTAENALLNQTHKLAANNTTSHAGAKATTGIPCNLQEKGEAFAVIVIEAYLQPGIVIMGLVLNTLVAILMRRPSLRRRCISLLFFFLAMCDNWVLVATLLLMHVKYLTGIEPKNSHPVACKVIYFLYHSSQTSSLGLVMLVAVERLIAICFPFKVKALLSRKRALVVSLLIPLMAAGIHAFHLFIMDLVPRAGSVICATRPEYRFFQQYVRAWVYMVVEFIIPISAVGVCNAIIIHQLMQMKAARSQMTGDDAKANDAVRHVTKTALAVCITMIVLMMPSFVYRVLSKLPGVSHPWLCLWPRWSAVLRALVAMLTVANFACNFFLYTLTSADFRRELVSLLGSIRKRPAAKPAVKSVETASESI